jgi:hypothetical protein
VEANEEGPADAGAKLSVQMGSRLLPLSLALGASLADLSGAHGLAALAVLLAIPAAAGVAFVAISDLLEGKRALLRTCTGSGALVLFLVGSAVRHGAAAGSAVPALAVSAVVGAAILYAVPALFWVLEPLAPRPRPIRPARAV